MLVVSFHKCSDRKFQLFDVPVCVTVNDLLWLIEPLRHSVGLWLRYECKARCYAPESDLVLEMIREILAAVSIRRVSPRAASAPTDPNLCFTAMEIGCRAANRSPALETCHPTHTAFQSSTAVKSQHQSSPMVKIFMPSVPHMTSVAAVIILPVCSLGPLFPINRAYSKRSR
jgi:hypothetical protein